MHLQEVPGSRLYWEQAARELDFCTCRKCQVVGAYLLEAKELEFCTCRKCQVVGSIWKAAREL